MEDLVSTEWLAGEVGNSDLRVIDATIFLPNSGRDARQEFEAAHIPGAVFLDLDREVAGAPGPDGRHPLPEPGALQTALRTAGVRAARPATSR